MPLNEILLAIKKASAAAAALDDPDLDTINNSLSPPSHPCAVDTVVRRHILLQTFLEALVVHELLDLLSVCLFHQGPVRHQICLCEDVVGRDAEALGGTNVQPEAACGAEDTGQDEVSFFRGPRKLSRFLLLLRVQDFAKMLETDLVEVLVVIRARYSYSFSSVEVLRKTEARASVVT